MIEIMELAPQLCLTDPLICLQDRKGRSTIVECT